MLSNTRNQFEKETFIQRISDLFSQIEFRLFYNEMMATSEKQHDVKPLQVNIITINWHKNEMMKHKNTDTNWLLQILAKRIKNGCKKTTWTQNNYKETQNNHRFDTNDAKQAAEKNKLIQNNYK